MSKFTNIAIAMIALSVITGNAGAVPVEEWNRTFRGAGNAFAFSVQQTADGGYILAGRSLIKTDASGSEQWNRTFNGSGTFKSVQQTSDGGYIGAGAINRESGDYHPDGWLIKTDENGDEQWNGTFWGGGFGVIESVQQTGDGGYVLAGTRSTIGGDTGGAWLIKVNANGEEQWNRTFGEWNRTFGGRGEMVYSIQQTSDGGYILAGFGFLFIKTDANGSMQWGKNKKFKGKDVALARSVQQTLDGGYIIAGESHTTGGYNKDSWLIKVDTDGNEQLNMTFGGAQEDEAYSIQQTGDGGYIVAGTTSYYGDSGSYAYLTKVSGEQTVSAKTPTANPTQTLTAVPTGTHKVSPYRKDSGFEVFLAISTLLLVVIIRRKRSN